MKKIVLLCTSGMSTSLLVSKMRKAAKELNVECTIMAISEGELRKVEENTDVLLLGPQVKYLSSRLNKKFEGKIPIGLINSSDYGIMNGKRVLKQAFELMNKELVENTL